MNINSDFYIVYTRIDHLQPGLSSILLGDDLGSFSRTSKTIQHKYLDYWITVACMERRETSGEAKRAARRTRGSAPKRPESQWDKFYFLSSVHMSQCDCVIWYLLEILEAKQTSKLPNVKLVLVQAGWMENEKCGGVRSAEYGKWGIWKMKNMENVGYGKWGVWFLNESCEVHCSETTTANVEVLPLKLSDIGRIGNALFADQFWKREHLCRINKIKVETSHVGVI